MTFSKVKIRETFMTAIFVLCSRKRKWIRSNVAEIVGDMADVWKCYGNKGQK